MLKLLGLAGKQFSGKSTVANFITQSLLREESTVIKLAQPLYDIQHMIYKTVGLPEPVKDRQLLQYLGTEWGRSKSPDLWINAWINACSKYRVYTSLDNLIIVDDLRYDNEAEVIKASGGKIIRIEAKDDDRAIRGNISGSGHASEAGISDKYVDATIFNNGDLASLYNNITYLFDVLNVEKETV